MPVSIEAIPQIQNDAYERSASEIEKYLIAEFGPDYGMATDQERRDIRRSNALVSKLAQSVRALVTK